MCIQAIASTYTMCIQALASTYTMCIQALPYIIVSTLQPDLLLCEAEIFVHCAETRRGLQLFSSFTGILEKLQLSTALQCKMFGTTKHLNGNRESAGQCYISEPCVQATVEKCPPPAYGATVGAKWEHGTSPHSELRHCLCRHQSSD